MEKNNTTGKRININETNLQKLKILNAVLENDTFGMNQKKKLDYIVNLAISEFYSSNQIKERLAL